MAAYHTVAQGEYLVAIARTYGFAKYTVIWDHPKNSDLKKRRQNPNVIFPGDQLFIPDKVTKKEPRPTGQLHRFVLETVGLKLRIVLEDLYEKPIADARCELRIDGQRFPLLTDGKGKIEKDIKPTARTGSLVVQDTQTPANRREIPIKIGHLDPVDEVSGQKARLNNLGYFAGPFNGNSDDASEARFLSAVEEFQCDHGLSVDGRCGPITQAKLKQVHGC
jgi:Putative peptidoglycan binding domain